MSPRPAPNVLKPLMWVVVGQHPCRLQPQHWEGCAVTWGVDTTEDHAEEYALRIASVWEAEGYEGVDLLLTTELPELP